MCCSNGAAIVADRLHMWFTPSGGFCLHMLRLNVSCRKNATAVSFLLSLETWTMKWAKPEYTDLRIGFEVTMYFANR